MINKEFLSELSKRSGYTNKETAQLVSSVLNIMTQELQEGNSVALQGFGTFEVKKKAELKLSFSEMTFPHTLMRLILTEQIYRGFTILSGTPYHK